MSGVHVYQCPLCGTFSTSAYRLWLSHLGQVHRNDSSFRVMCGYHGCAETKNSYSSLYSHVYRKHSELIRKRCQATCRDEDTLSHFPSTYETTDDAMDSELSGEDFQRLMGTDVESQRRSSALFLLKLKEKRRLTQTAIDDVVEGARLLFSQTAQRIRAGINDELAKNAVEIDISSIFTNLVDPFHGLETQFLQEKYFTEKFGLIEPEEVKLGNPYYEQRFTGHKRQVTQRQDSFHYIPLLSTLKALLKDTGVLEQVLSSSSRVRTDGIMNDFCDGQLFHNNPLFSSNPSALQIIAYYDELEICNPLGAYVKKHKLGVVAFSLGNIHPKYRSSLRTISLVSLATVPLIERYGIDEILKPFVNDLNILSTVGITVDVDGVEHTFKGGLLTFLGDTLALHEVGGFKCSVSRAFRICRTCMATNSTASTHFNSKHFEKRSDTKHCEAISGPLSEHYSVAYGVVRRSILLDVNSYYMFEGGLPHDIMHDLYEGVVQYEMKLLLTYLVDKNLLTIQEFNKRLINFDYGYSEVADKPTPITRANFKSGDKKLRQGASQCMLLARILPLLLVDCFDDDDPYWECYLCLIKISNICLSPMLTMNMCATLKVLIEEHHTRFREVYPEETIIPKMHYMCHYPEQILQVGPLTNSWTMRHEGRLHVLKQAAHLGNYKNITLTLCRRQQRWICYEMASGSILSPTLECGPGPSPTTLASEPPSRQNAISLFLSEVSADTTVFKPTWVKRQGILFKNKDCYVVIGTTTDGEPHFGRLDEIIVLASGLVLFVLSPCTSLFDLHLHAYCVTLQANQIIHSLDNLKDYSVYHGHKTGNDLYIIPKYNIVM